MNKNFGVYGLVLSFIFSAVASFADTSSSDVPDKIFLRKNAASTSTRLSSSPLMSYHGGNVLKANSTMAIFWGSSWSNSTFAGDKISGMDSFFTGFGGSEYSGAGTEYYDTTGNVTTSSTYLGYTIDTSTVPTRALKTSQAIAEACKITANNPNPNALYVIYTSVSVNTNYCGWHTWGQCSNGLKIQVAYIPNLDGIAGCDPGDTVTGHSQGLAAIANVTAHELMETITDPRGNAWYDSSGSEIGDKCAWAFPPNNQTELFLNNTIWKLQMEWSNNAYTTNTGLPNLNGQKGCIF